VATRPSLTGAWWPQSTYPRAELPERVLQFGTGMLLRAVCAAAVDAANRQGRFRGRIVVVQSTPGGRAPDLNTQDGLFTLVERGLEGGAPIDRTRLVGSISRALVADSEWDAVRAVAARPELQVIVSNVTEAGFRPDGGFPDRLTDLLYHRFERLPDGPPLFVIPTELVPDNGVRLAEMVDQVAAARARGGGRGGGGATAFRDWCSRAVRFCSSLVDRITTGAPEMAARAELEARLGYADALLTVTEPHCLWAVAADPDDLRSAFAVDDPPAVIFAPDITFYSERKLRLLNGAHTALAPLALLAGVATVREAAEHPRFGALLRQILFQEIAPATDLPAGAADAFARTVLDRFRNPWLDHRWDVIAANQTAKLRVRVVPSIVAYGVKHGRPPRGLALGCAAYLRWARSHPAGDGDLGPIERYWGEAETAAALGARALGDATVWGTDLSQVPGFVAATTDALVALERDGPAAAVDEALSP
jgi:tagaturonate reductase